MHRTSKLVEKIQGECRYIYFYCPGCKSAHPFTVSHSSKEAPTWTFDENFESPTFSPSLLSFYQHPQTKQRVTTCHLFVKKGVIEFCSDCPHELKGQKVPLPDFPPDYGI